MLDLFAMFIPTSISLHGYTNVLLLPLSFIWYSKKKSCEKSSNMCSPYILTSNGFVWIVNAACQHPIWFPEMFACSSIGVSLPQLIGIKAFTKSVNFVGILTVPYTVLYIFPPNCVCISSPPSNVTGNFEGLPTLIIPALP